MKIGIRTLKTALGAGVAIWMAVILNLDNATSAGIITILCIERTKLRSIRVSIDRIIACIMGMLVSGLMFELFGYHPAVFALYILGFIPLLVQFRLQNGFITSTVIVLHIFAYGDFSLALFSNELAIILIGIGMALLLNVYIPSLEHKLIHYQEAIEGKIKVILYEYAVSLERADHDWNGKELLELEALLEEAQALTLQDVENTFLRKEHEYVPYFNMRDKQFEILKRMLPIIAQIKGDIPQRDLFASFMYDMSAEVTSENNADAMLNRLEQKRAMMKALPLPATRAEFESRAELFHLMNEIELYLKLKNRYLND
ncbi:aromatic acid exporter family protein [Caldalkalibacillus salinus]|uniref:aromatic acid exporter family protein n=1 Tax=Caldalkalibacillus salinus TaxID=2803787 RepID=UPI0019242D32|nr:aromatic acid exporter family protein [Caldalkalibacillus salinus]